MLTRVETERKHTLNMTAMRMLVAVILTGIMVIPSVFSEVIALGMNGKNEMESSLKSAGFNDQGGATPGLDAVISWSTSANSYVIAIEGSRLVSYNGYLVNSGGYSSSSYVDVRKAQVQSDGNIGPWSATTSLPAARAFHGAVASNGYIYVVGGTADGSTYATTVYYAAIDSNANVGMWNTAVNALPVSGGWGLGELAVCNGYLYAIGGYWGTGASSSVYYSQIGPGGQPGAWTSTTSLPDIRSRLGFDNLVYNNKIYVPGGWDGLLTATSTVYYASCGSGAITAWNTATNDLPTSRMRHSAVMDTDTGQIYVISGYTGSDLLGGYVATTNYGNINPGTGNIDSAWRNGPDLPAIRRYAGAAYTSTRTAINAVTGSDASSVGQTTVYYGKTNSNAPPDTPTLSKPWDFQKGGEWANALRPEFIFSTTDPEGNDTRYHIQVSTDPNFGSTVIDAISGTDAGFSDLTNPPKTDPFTSGDTIKFTAQSDLTSGTTYWWKVQAKDPTGSNVYSSFSVSRSLTVQTGVLDQRWFQTTKAQFDRDTLTDGTYTTNFGGGDVETNGTVLKDRFDDNDYTNNPTWTVYAGAFSAANGYLESTTTGPDRASVPFSFLSGFDYTWEFRLRHEANDASDSILRFYPFVSTADTDLVAGTTGYYLYANTVGGYFDFYRQDGTSIVNVFTATITDDTNWNVIRISRTALGAWSIYRNGVQQGSTVVDTTYTSGGYVGLRDQAYNTAHNVYIDNLYVNASTELISAPIDSSDGPQFKKSWDIVTWNKDVTSGTITVAVQKYTASWLWTGIQSSTSPIDISSLGTPLRIRLIANLTYSSGSPKLLDWEASWKSTPPYVPTLSKPWDFQKSGEWASSLRPEFVLNTTDPDGNDVRYNIQVDNDPAFGSPEINTVSGSDPGFTDITNITDTDPFASGDMIRFTVQSDLTSGMTYWWRVRAIDPLGSNSYSTFSQSWSLTVETGILEQSWYQTTEEQFARDILGSGTITTASGGGDVETAAIGPATITIQGGTALTTWGTGNTNPEDPFNTYYHDSRAQVVYLASELLSAGMSTGTISSIQLYCYEKHGRPNLANFRIRMQLTSATTSTSFVTSGWTLVYGPTNAITTAGAWYTFTLGSSFNWDGISNILIDLTRDDTTYLANGGMYVRTGGLTNRMFAGYGDSTSSWPFDTGLATQQQNSVPALKITYTPLSGRVTSPTINYADRPSTKNYWGNITWNKDVTFGSVAVAVQKYTTSWVWANVQSTSSPIIIQSLATTAQIRLIANLTYSGGSPKLLDWEVSWSSATPPSVLLTSPNGGENWIAGSTQSIIWNPATQGTYPLKANPISLYYSTAGSTGPWTLIAGNLPNSGSYSWLIPSALTSNAYVRIEAADNQGPPNVGYDVSNGAFTISSPIPPSVTVTKPNGGEKWFIQAAYDITWTASQGTFPFAANPMTISYSTAGATGPWTQIAANLPNSGLYNWSIPASVTPSANAYIKVDAKDNQPTPNVGNDTGNSAFTLANGNAPAVTVTSPNGGENWAISTNQDVKWTAVQGTFPLSANPITIYYSTSGPLGPWAQIITNLVNTGTYQWTVQGPPSANAYVKVEAKDDRPTPNLGNDTGDAAFSISQPPNPNVMGTVPVNGATNVSLNTTIVITFSEAMNKSATEGSISSSPAISGSFSWNGAARIVTWTPSANLMPNTQYTVTISTSAKSQAGMNLANPHIFTFTTMPSPDIYPPYILSTTPTEGATNISNATNIDIKWNESMNQTSAEGAFSSAPAIACAWSWSGTNQTCTPSSTLLPGTRYTITIAATAKDPAGNAMKNEFTLNFTTAASIVPTPPTVTSTSPANGSMNVPINTNVAVTFSEAMNKTAAQAAISANPSITGAFAWDGTAKTVTWNPSTDLQPSTKYMITISNSAKSQAGADMKNAYAFSFTTSQLPDIYPPIVVATNPTNGATGIQPDTKIEIQWNESMDHASTESAFSSSPAIACAWSWGGAIQTCTPTAKLQAGTKYTITIDSTAKDIAGNAMTKPYTFAFTTGSPPDTTPPTVTRTNPPNGSKDVDNASKITITFSEVMDQVATGGSVSIVPGSITKKEWNANGTILTLTATLETGTRYTVTISTGAKDVAGNAMTSKYTFTFTTKDNEGPGSTAGIGTLPIVLILIIVIIVCSIIIAVLLKRRKAEEERHVDLLAETKREPEKGKAASASESVPKPTTTPPSEPTIGDKPKQPHVKEQPKEPTKKAAVPSGIKCSSCGKDVPAGKKWCLNCGEEIVKKGDPKQ